MNSETNPNYSETSKIVFCPRDISMIKIFLPSLITGYPSTGRSLERWGRKISQLLICFAMKEVYSHISKIKSNQIHISNEMNEGVLFTHISNQICAFPINTLKTDFANLFYCLDTRLFHIPQIKYARRVPNKHSQDRSFHFHLFCIKEK